MRLDPMRQNKNYSPKTLRYNYIVACQIKPSIHLTSLGYCNQNLGFASSKPIGCKSHSHGLKKANHQYL